MSQGPHQPPTELFLSHASLDRGFVDQVVGVLRGHAIPIWYSATNIIGAQQWHDEIGRALARCDWFAIVLSPHSLTSEWVKRELHYALRKPRYNNKIVPLLLVPDDYDPLSWTLANFQNVDFTTDHHSGYRDLLRIWGVGYVRTP